MVLKTKPFDERVPSLQKTIRHKFGKMQSLFNGINNCDITIKKVNNGQAKHWLVAAKVDLPGEVLFAKEMAESSQKATDLVIAAIESQLRKYKEQATSSSL